MNKWRLLAMLVLLGIAYYFRNELITGIKSFFFYVFWTNAAIWLFLAFLVWFSLSSPRKK